MAQTEQAIFSHGLQRHFDYTPSSAIAAGDIVPFGTGLERFIAIANAAIAANVAGSLEFAGIYKFKKKSGTTFAIGEQIGWDDGNEQAVNHDDGDVDYLLATCVGPAAGTDDYVLGVINQARGWEGSGSGL